jgi:hypothetical protein
MSQDIGHCGIFFNPARTFFAMGNVKNPKTGKVFTQTNGYASGKLATLPNFQHPIPTGAHFNKTDINAKLKKNPIVFRAVHYVEDTGRIKRTNGFVHFRGVWNPMNRVAGNATRGVYEFETTASTGASACEPYYFRFEQKSKKSHGGGVINVTLPQNADNYRFGTRGLRAIGSGIECDENHYYKHTDGMWYANRTPDAKGKTTCLGCHQVGTKNGTSLQQ